MRITAHYGLGTDVPFLDIDVSCDNLLFVDPRAIRLQALPTDSFAASALECIDTFAATVFNHVTGGHAGGLNLLTEFTEPWETRLGMSRSGFQGHGGAQEVGSRIWEALNTDLEALLRVGVLRHLEDLALFVDGVDRDIVSDITTRIILGPLLDFTHEMLERFPGLQRDGLRDTEWRVWDPTRLAWIQRSAAVPLADGRPLVLIPRHWARSTLLMSAERFYATTVLDRVQLEQLVVNARGELLKTPKRHLRGQALCRPGRHTNLRVVGRALADDEDLLARFRAFVDAKYLPYSAEELDRKIA